MATTVMVHGASPVELFQAVSARSDLDAEARHAARRIAAELPAQSNPDSPIFGGPNTDTPSEYRLAGAPFRFLMGDYVSGQPTRIDVVRVPPGRGATF
jgi:hypothetical protein